MSYPKNYIEPKKVKIWVVIAYRFGENSNHSYTVGIFSKKHKAIECADSHCSYRGLKYSCCVEECTMDTFDNNSDSYSKEVYRAKSNMDV